MEIFVFRTGVIDHTGISKIAPQLDSMTGIYKWSFDLEDHEKILRVEAAGILPGQIVKVLEGMNYHCEELPD